MTHVKFNNRPVVRPYDSFFTDFFNLPATWGTASGNSVSVSANVTETPQAYYLDLNVPGRNKEDFRINIEKDLLTVSYEKKEEQKTEGLNSIRTEFNFNSFKRSFSLDERIDSANIQAKYENGILKIELPKKEQVKEEPKTISVN
jgi:HSP20 family protein